MKTSRFHSSRGSALITVMMFSLGLILIVSTLLTLSLAERRLNYRQGMRLEARNAAEAISEYGLSQVRELMNSRSDFSSTRFTSDQSQVAMPLTSFWGGTNVVTSGANAPQMVIGLITQVSSNATSGLYYFDPADPNNEFEPLKGRYALRFDIRVLSKASVHLAGGAAGPAQTAYMTQTLSARASPLFSHAIFYNMDLEFWPSQNMVITGGVHTNGKLYARKYGSAQSSWLTFSGPVSAANGYYSSGVKLNPKTSSGGVDNILDDTDNHRHTSAAGALVNIKGPKPGTSSPDIWRDHFWGETSETSATREAFRQWATSSYGGNLMTNLHGVQVYNPVAIGSYVEDPTPTNGVDNSVNDARQIIEAPKAAADAGYNAEVEAQKYATLCGLYIVVNNSTTTRTGRKPDGSTISIPSMKYRAFTKTGVEVVLPGQPDYGTNNATVNATGNLGGRPIILLTPTGSTSAKTLRDIRRTDVNYLAARSATNPYTVKTISVIDVDMIALKMAVDKTVNSLTTVDLYDSVFPNSTTIWARSIYNPSATPAAVALTSANVITNFTSTYWNGGIYILSVDAETRQDSGVRLINGRGRAPSATDNTGLTIATNDAMYILGHYNADGTIDATTTSPTYSPRYPDSTSETPTALAADAITVLSNPVYSGSGTTYTQGSGWNDALTLNRINTSWSTTWATTPPSSSNQTDGDNVSRTPFRVPYDSGSGTTGSARTEKFAGAATEISAALLCGQVPSNKNGTDLSGGGVHNFPRLLENWGGTNLCIRGSMVAMFESRVADEPWSTRNYGAPSRIWGFHEYFNQGRFPPLTPRVMSYRRVDFSDIDAATYNSVKSSWGL